MAHNTGGHGGTLRQEDPANQLTDLDRAARAIEAIKMGMTYQEAADYAGYANRGTAYKVVKRALTESAQQLREDAQELRALEVARLDLALVEIARIALSPSSPPDLKIKYLEAMRRNIETRAALLGLNAAIQHEVFTHDAVNARIAELSERLGLPVPERVLTLGAGPAQAAADLEGPPES